MLASGSGRGISITGSFFKRPQCFTSNTKNPPEIDKDVEKIVQKGVSVYLVKEGAEERGLTDGDLLSGIKKVKRQSLPELIDQYDQVWY